MLQDHGVGIFVRNTPFYVRQHTDGELQKRVYYAHFARIVECQERYC